jgi:hypothetical protein
MSISIQDIKKALARSKQEHGLLERLGARYYRYLGNTSGTASLRNRAIDELPDDLTLQALATNITTFAVIIAFAIGAVTTFVTIWFEVRYSGTMKMETYYFLYGTILIIMLVIELLVLYWLGLKTVHSLACLTGHHQSHEDIFLPVNDSVPNILARAALEVPDPVIHHLGIEPLKHLSKPKLVLVAALYKAKVILTSMMVRYLLIRLLGKGGSRTAFTWVAIPITGLWDAFTLHKVARDARLRLFGLKLAEYIAANVLTDDLITRLSPTAREGAIRAVASSMVLAQNYHPNLLVLLLRLSNAFECKEGIDYDNWEDFLTILNQAPDAERYFLLDLVSVCAAFDGRLSRMEQRHLPEAFQDLTDLYMNRVRQLTKMLVSGRLHAAKALCALNFTPG